MWGLPLSYFFIGLGIGSFDAAKKICCYAAGTQAPVFEVDPLWPETSAQPLIQGNIIGVSVDAQDHIWTIHRGVTLEPKEVYATTNPPALNAVFLRHLFLSTMRRAILSGIGAARRRGMSGRTAITA